MKRRIERMSPSVNRPKLLIVLQDRQVKKRGEGKDNKKEVLKSYYRVSAFTCVRCHVKAMTHGLFRNSLDAGQLLEYSLYNKE